MLQMRCINSKMKLLSSTDPCDGKDYMEVAADDAIITYNGAHGLTMSIFRSLMQQVQPRTSHIFCIFAAVSVRESN